MACLARLAGQYTLERQSPPGQRTLAFLGARCGVADPRLGYAFVTQPLRGGESEDDVQKHMRQAAEEGIRNALQGGGLTAGIWFGREKLRAVAMVVHARPLARLETLPAVPGPDGHVVLRGELLRPAARIEALINRGRYGFRRCSLDPTLALPRFAVDCETDSTDEAEALEIGAFPPGRVMDRSCSGRWSGRSEGSPRPGASRRRRRGPGRRGASRPGPWSRRSTRSGPPPAWPR